MGKILVIGSANVDLVIHASKIPTVGETIVGSDFSVGAGGKGLNQAVAVKKLGGDVTFMGALGDDTNGEMLKKTLDNYNINNRCVLVSGRSTGCAMIVVVEGDNFIVVDEGANACVTPDMVEGAAELISDADIVLIQYEIPVESIARIAELASAGGAMLVVNPAPYKELCDGFYSLCDLLVPNEHEAYALTGIYPRSIEDAMAALDALLEKGVKKAVITLGANGCVYGDRTQKKYFPAVKTIAVDTTSAGDSFIGALCVRLSLGADIERAIEYATRAAALTVSRAGASISIPYASELE